MFPSYNPFPANSDRCSQEWLDSVPVFQESAGYRHVRKTNRATGQTWMCIESPGGRLLAEFTLGMRYPRITLIRREGDEGQEFGREIYGMAKTLEPPEKIELLELKSLVESGLRSGDINLFSREETLPSGMHGSIRSRQQETVWDQHGRPLGESTATHEYSATGGLKSREVGDHKTEFDSTGPIAAPLSTTNAETDERETVYTVDLVSDRGRKTRIVEDGKPVGLWTKLKSVFGRTKT